MTPTLAPREVEDRLRALPGSLAVTPEDSHALARLHVYRLPSESTREARRGFRPVASIVAIAGLVLLVVVANVVLVYFAPAYGRVLADTPGIGPASGRMLAALGLSTSDVVGFDSSATSSGHTIRLVAGYADALRTDLFIEIDGRGMSGNPKGFGINPGDYMPNFDSMTLTDQFGRTYGLSGVSGGPELSFEGLKWPTPAVGARLTLHISAIVPTWTVPFGPDVTGSWTLHGTLVPGGVDHATLPAPLATPEAVYTFTSVKASGKTIAIRYTVTGSVVDQIDVLWEKFTPPVIQSPPYSALMDAYFAPQMFDASGRPIQMSSWGFNFGRKGERSPVLGVINAYIPGPGRYRIQLGSALSATEDERWIVVS